MSLKVDRGLTLQPILFGEYILAIASTISNKKRVRFSIVPP